MLKPSSDAFPVTKQGHEGVHAQSLSGVWLFATPWTVAYQASLSMGFSRQEYLNGLPCPPPGDLLNPGITPESLTSPALAVGSFPLEPPGKHLEVDGLDLLLERRHIGVTGRKSCIFTSLSVWKQLLNKFLFIGLHWVLVVAGSISVASCWICYCSIGIL